MDDVGDNHTHTNVPLNAHDGSLPLAGVVVCCTSVADVVRATLFENAKAMGAVCEFDLTNDVTHLIVGNPYSTPKYRYVAKERPDVKPMTLDWIEAMRQLWMNDVEIDVEALEKEHALPILHSLKFSMTGCDDTVERQAIADEIEGNGAEYSGDLTKSVTHLISFRTEGNKYKAAKSWKIHVVSIEWLRDTLERGMILDEALYDPILPQEERGKGAWDQTKPKIRSLGKRARADSTALEGGKRKLRRTASTKLNSQSESMWGDIVGSRSVLQVAQSGQWRGNGEEPANPNDEAVQNKPKVLPDAAKPPQQTDKEPKPDGIFSGSRFYFHGFNPQKAEVLSSHIVPLGGEVSQTLEELRSELPTNTSKRLFMIVPHDLSVSKCPELPEAQVPIETITTWWVERCLHHKKFMDPDEHVIGRPFPVFPVEGFAGLTICSSAFSGIDLLHFTKVVELLGAKYSEDMTRQISILVNKSLQDLRKDKLEHALEWKIPIVKSDWLWDCIKAGKKLSSKDYRCRKQKRSESFPSAGPRPQTRAVQHEDRQASIAPKQISRATSLPSKHAKPPRHSGLDNSAFAPDDDVNVDVAALKQENDSCTLDLPEGSPTQEFSSRSEPLSDRNPNSSSKTVSTAPAPSNHPGPRSLREDPDISNAISDLINKTKTKTAIQPSLSEPTEGRKRNSNRILGRVTSNISTASSNHSRGTSVDSTATHGPAVEWPPYDDSTNERMEMLINGDKNTHRAGDSQPPPTQLQYEDPESEAVTEMVMAKMMGDKAPPKRKGLKEKAVTIGNFEPKARATRQGKAGLR